MTQFQKEDRYRKMHFFVEKRKLYHGSGYSESLIQLEVFNQIFSILYFQP